MIKALIIHTLTIKAQASQYPHIGGNTNTLNSQYLHKMQCPEISFHVILKLTIHWSPFWIRALQKDLKCTICSEVLSPSNEVLHDKGLYYDFST